MQAESKLELPEVPEVEPRDIHEEQQYQYLLDVYDLESTDILIDIINLIEDLLADSDEELEIKLPEIVVIGSQSAGKSSVLENIIGKEFLPRGAGVVTRRPTVVRLHPSDREWASFNHQADVVFEDFGAVMREIAAETMRVPGPQGFSSEPIYLNIYSRNVLKLTLVDMPGLIRNVIGDQSESSVEEVRSMVRDRIANPDAIIVAVSPANQDLATSEALEIAKLVDPDRERTLGVMTKLDLMDEGTDARDVLENKKIKLKKGYVGVINRGQREIDERKDMGYIWDKEKKFFKNHKAYKHMAHRMGCLHLQKKLSEMLKHHVKICLPHVRVKLLKKLSKLRKQLSSYESLLISKEGGRSGVKFHMLSLIQRFIDNYFISIQGYSDKVSMQEISAGTQIHQMFFKDLQNSLNLPPIPSEQELIVLTANIHGIRNSFSLPSLALDTACKSLIQTYDEPIQRFIDKISDILLVNAQNISDKLGSYPLLKKKILVLINTAVTKAAEKTKIAVAEHLNADKCYVLYYFEEFKPFEYTDEEVCYTEDVVITSNKTGEELLQPSANEVVKISADFSPKVVKFGAKTIKPVSKKKANYSRSNLRMLTDMIEKYLEKQRTQTIEVCIKYTVYFLIQKILHFNQFELIPSIMEDPNFNDMIAECERDFMILQNLESRIKNLENALEAIQTF